MLKKLSIIVLLVVYSIKVYAQGTIDSSSVELRTFHNKNLEELRKDPDFDYTEKDRKDRQTYDNQENGLDGQTDGNDGDNANSGRRKVRKEETKALNIEEGAIYIAAAIAIIFLVLALLGINPMGLFRKNTKVVVPEIDEEDIDKLDKNNLDEKINQAIVKGDYTQAVRFLYLKTLFLLSQKQYIQLQREKTNLEYQQELKQSKNTLYEDFKYQSKIFAYIKYGGFEISQFQFDTLHPQFKNLHSKI